MTLFKVCAYGLAFACVGSACVVAAQGSASALGFALAEYALGGLMYNVGNSLRRYVC